VSDPAPAGLVRLSIGGGTATITLDSPGNANALSDQLSRELIAALDTALGDRGARVIVLTATGRVFCAGADLKEALTGPGVAARRLGEIIERIWDSPKPVLGRVNGSARAGGVGLIAACDLAIGPESATFAFSEVRIGVAPAVIAVPCLRRISGRAAAEYFLTGEVFDGTRAAQIGLLTRAVPAAELDEQVSRYVDMLLRGAPGALAATKNVLRDVPARSVADGLAEMAELSAEIFASDEAREGMTAFASKRDPPWTP
jgi:methylglutaconyl-CoA hydratase